MPLLQQIFPLPVFWTAQCTLSAFLKHLKDYKILALIFVKYFYSMIIYEYIVFYLSIQCLIVHHRIKPVKNGIIWWKYWHFMFEKWWNADLFCIFYDLFKFTNEFLPQSTFKHTSISFKHIPCQLVLAIHPGCFDVLFLLPTPLLGMRNAQIENLVSFDELS